MKRRGEEGCAPLRLSFEFERRARADERRPCNNPNPLYTPSPAESLAHLDDSAPAQLPHEALGHFTQIASPAAWALSLPGWGALKMDLVRSTSPDSDDASRFDEVGSVVDLATHCPAVIPSS